jgi:hypothetical protein
MRIFFIQLFLPFAFSFSFQALANAVDVHEISPGAEHICRLDSNGLVKCWGSNGWDDGSILPPANLGPALSVQSGDGFSCAILANSSVRCWGSNRDGQLNVPEGLGSVQQLAVGSSHSCALQANGKVVCWGGTNNAGQLNVPVGLGPAQSISAGKQTSCAIAADGTGTCWGLHKLPANIGKVAKLVTNSEKFLCAKLANGLGRCFGNVAIPKELGPIKDLAVGYNHICVITSDDLTKCWGEIEVPEGQEYDFVSLASSYSYNTCGLKANGHYSCWGGLILHPPPEFASLKLRDIAGNGTYFCGIDIQDLAHCWGLLSDGGPENQIPTDLGPVKIISIGYYDACAITQSNQIRCWGNYHHKGFQNSMGSGEFSELDVGSAATCAVEMSGNLKCWGQRVQMPQPFTSIQKVSVGEAACAVDSLGILKCFSVDSFGDRFVPPSHLPAAVDFKMSSDYGCLLDQEGKLTCFGEPGMEGEFNPVPTDLGNVVQFSIGTWDACTVNDQNDLRCWVFEWNAWGYAEPIQEKVRSVVAGNGNGCAILMDQSLKCWSVLKDAEMD